MTNSSVKILVVDDEAPIRKLLRVGLSTQGYTVSEAENARAAIEEVRITQPDLILLDLGLPDISGHDLLRRWRDEGSELPVVILSSRTDERGIVEALELGADDYVTKPFGMNELVARIRVALRHRLQQQGRGRSSRQAAFRLIWSNASSRSMGKKSNCRRRNMKSCASLCSMRVRL